MPQTFHRRTHVRAVENRVPLKPSKHVYGAHMRLSMLAKAPLRKVISSETRRVRSLGVERERESEKEHSVTCEKTQGWESSMNWSNSPRPVREN